MSNTRVLSIDGGGLRGLIPLQVLKALEVQTGKPCWQNFDFIVGTSTGGIIALALAQGFTAAECEQLYLEHAHEIFAKSLFTEMDSVFGLKHPKYGAEGIEHVLQAHFGTRKLGDAKVACGAVAFELETHMTQMLDSRIWAAAPVWKAARATSAAPTFFPPYSYTDMCTLIDGGLACNCPALFAIAELAAGGVAFESFRVLSLGTGLYEPMPSYKQCKDWGELQWASPAISIAMDGSADVHALIAEQLLDNRALRLDTPIDNALAPMDSIGNMPALVKAGEALAADSRTRLLAWLSL